MKQKNPQTKQKTQNKDSTQTQNIHCEIQIQDKSDLLREIYCTHAESIRVFPVSQIKILRADG